MLAKLQKLLSIHLNHSGHPGDQERREFVQKTVDALSEWCIVVVAIKQATLEPHVQLPSKLLN